MAWEHFNTLINIGPNLAIQDPILLQHFYMGLDRKTSKLLNTASGGSFLHVSASLERNILTKILENIPEEV
jgi:transcriptional regulator of NAD metabolism